MPISAVITDDAGERHRYDQVLDQVSKPLMQAMREHVVFEPRQTIYPDGVVSNFVFHGDDQARPWWRYPDLGPHVIFLANIIGRTLTEQMREESLYLRRHARARAALKEVPVLAQFGVWAEVVDVVSRTLGEESADKTVIDRYRPSKPAGR